MKAGTSFTGWHVLLWLMVIMLSLFGSYFNSILADTPFHLRQELPFVARWVVWIPLTPIAVRLVQKMYFTEHRAVNFITYHVAVYLALCVVHVFLASLTAKGINILLKQPASYPVILKKCALAGLFFNSVVYVIILLLLNGSRYYSDLQQERIKTISLEKSLADTRLQFLRQQLQPHFLFNTHHSIITLIKMGEKEKAAVMLEKLSELMRVALREADEQKVTLQREIDVLKLYVDIQQTRFEDRMLVEYDIERPVYDALVPSLMLQPLVENSIKYAVESSPATTKIRIAATRQDKMLLVTVKDEYNGNETRETINKGIGLSNPEERLYKLYGNQSSISIKPYRLNDTCGMEVMIKIPLQHATV